METQYSKKIKDHYDSLYSKNYKLNRYYLKSKLDFFKFHIPKKKRVLEIGCGNGDLISALNPSNGLGIDISKIAIKVAKNKHKKVKFLSGNTKKLTVSTNFDFVILPDVVGELEDIQSTLEDLNKVINSDTRIIITFYSFLWAPILKIAEILNLKNPAPYQNWLSTKDVQNLLELVNFEVIKKGVFLLFPFDIPIISTLINKYIARLPLIKNLCLIQYLIVRQGTNQYSHNEYSVSVIVPARNEAGNIESLINRLPNLGKSMEVIFVEGHSKDNTLSEIKQVIKKYHTKRPITLIKQGSGVGKASAVRLGFAKARGDVLMILDADLSVKPEELSKFYQAIRQNHADLVMGTRLVYPMEKDAMRFLNILGNKFFSIAFSWLLDQPIKDTLCGTKVLLKKNYLKIASNRRYFGDFDPFGDFDLIFGASKLNLKITEIPIRYMARTYGKTNIDRFRHGLLLLKMTLIAAKKLKFT